MHHGVIDSLLSDIKWYPVLWNEIGGQKQHRVLGLLATQPGEGEREKERERVRERERSQMTP